MARPRALDLAFLCILFLAQTSPTRAYSIERKSSEPDPNTSNGTCYYGPGQEADSSYIPCGNSAYGNIHCCEASTTCLDNNACYDADGTTYVAGCTDPTYTDPSCPSKGIYNNQQWSGLVYCNGTSDEWTLCDDSSANINTVVPVPGCYCPEDESSRNIAFSAPAPIPPQASLPASNGGAMSLFPGYTPSTVLTSTAISTPKTTKTSSPTTTSAAPSKASPSTDPSSSDSASSTSASSAPSSSGTASDPASPATSSSSEASSSGSSVSGIAQSSSTPSPGLSTGVKVGIGIGASIAGLGAVAFIIAAIWFCRRRQKLATGGTYEKGSIMEVDPIEGMETDDITALPQRNSAWSANKSELAVDESTSVSAMIPRSVQQSWSRPLSEVEGSVPTFQSMASLGAQELDGTSRRPGFEPYRRAEVSRNTSQGLVASSTASQSSYRPGRHVEHGVYEMPAHLPGSTLM